MLSRRLSPTVATLVPPEAAPGSHTTTVTGVPSEAPAGALTALCASPPTIAITLVSPQASAGKLTDRWSPQAWCVARFSRAAAGKLRNPGSPQTLVRSFIFTCLVSLLACLAALPTSAQATTCPNEGVRLQEGDAVALPDCRAYEQVSPSAKNLNDAIGRIDVTQSSPSGEDVAFGSLSPFSGVSGSSDFSTYLSTRAPGGGEWSTQGLLPETEGGDGATVVALTEDLSEALIQKPSSASLYNTVDRLTAPFFPVAVFYAASANDSDILFGSREALLPGAEAGQPNVYESREGSLSLVAADAVAGPGAAAVGGNEAHYYTQDTISANGFRVFFTSLDTNPAQGLTEEHIYMREDLGEPVAVSNGAAEWLASTPSGSMVFYSEGGRLYRFDVELYFNTKEPSRARELIAESGVQGQDDGGMLGISETGSYAYFAAGANIYVWHEGEEGPTFIAHSGAGEETSQDWVGGFGLFGAGGAEEGAKSSRVSADGRALLFASTESLTGYDTAGHIELYLYDAENAKLTCVSCNPSGQAATANSYLAHKVFGNFAEPYPRNTFLTRNLSDDGGRVFFQTEEALLPQDVNDLSNVHEWEREGSGSCLHATDPNGGCLYLISSGQGDSPAYFGDASADGSNVFFFTRQSLVAQDQDENIDLYDARENGGIAAQNEGPAAACEDEEGCRGAPVPQSVFGMPVSTTFSGIGNLAPPQSAPVAKSKAKSKPKRRCGRGYTRNRHGKCVKAKKTAKRAR